MKCIYPNCTKKPVYYCECEFPSVHMCSEHTDYHMTSGNKYEHVCRVLINPLTPKQIQSLQLLKQNLISKRFEETRALAENHSKQLKDLNSEFSKSLKSTHEKFDRFIKAIEFALISKKAEYKSLVETISDSVFSQKTYTYFIHKSCKGIQKVDYLLRKNSLFELPDQTEVGKLACLLEISPNTFFHYGGYQHKVTLFITKGRKTPSNSCGIINLSNKTYNKVESTGPGRCLPGLVQIDDFIYIFGGIRSNGLCQKLNLSSKKWKNIRSIDKSSEETSAVISNQQIVIASNRSEHVYLYNPRTDTVQTLFSCTSGPKVLLKSRNGEIFLLVSNRVYLSADADIWTWRNLGNTELEIFPQQGSSVEVDEHIYFTMLPYQHYRFNTRQFILEKWSKETKSQ